MWERKTAQLVADARATTTLAPRKDILKEWAASLSTTLIDRKEQSVGAGDNATSPINNIAPPSGPPQNTQTIVGPLLTVTWGQGCTYNEQCPSGAYCNTHAPTGCVMTSMAQIMAYWRYPATYNWASMPNDHGNAEVQRLMVDAGSSLTSADYRSTDTGAYLSDAADDDNAGEGFKNSRFGYQSVKYVSYDYNIVKDNLNKRQPVILGGCRDQTNRFLGMIYTYNGCHAWVCDGYQESCYYDQDSEIGAGTCYLMFHMNWGWHEYYSSAGSGAYGDYNGWYQYDNWNIPGINRNYQYANDMVVDIHP